MKVLVLSCHPVDESFTGHLRERALATLDSRHDVRHVDVYRGPDVPVEDLEWAEALVVVYPTWWSAPPAALVGWLDRALTRQSHYPGLRRIDVVTTHGSTWLVNLFEGEVGRKVFLRGLRRLAHPRCRGRWIAMYNVDRSNRRRRGRFVSRVEGQLAALG